jgi:hypothetical protein
MIDESVIRERAYALWIKDACPEDADLFYWFLAREQLETALKRTSVESDVCDGNDKFFNKIGKKQNEVNLRSRKRESA